MSWPRIDSDVCAVDDCGRPRAICVSGGRSRWCNTHRSRQYRRGDVMADVPVREPIGSDLCAVEGCEGRRWRGRRWCNAHRWRFRRHGDVRVDVPVRRRNASDGAARPSFDLEDSGEL